MNKLTVIVTLCFLSVWIYSQSIHSETSPDNDMLYRFNQLSMQQLLDTAKYYFSRNSIDTALICYNLIINAPVKEDSIKQHKLIIEALNECGIIYRYVCDYRKSFELLIKALNLCEKYGYVSYESKIYTNIGNIYYRFNGYKQAKQYYSKALSLCENSTDMSVILNNLGVVELEEENIDSAFYFVNKSLQMSRQHNDAHLHIILNTVASIYVKSGQYDSAFYCFRQALHEARKNRKIEREAENLSCLGKLFMQVNNADSALHSIALSNIIARENSFFEILAENYLLLSQIEESKDCHKKALEYYKQYANLKDSIFNTGRFGEINQLQRLYEVSKTNQQIEQLAIEQQIKERTIYYQRIILFITLVVLLLVSGVLLYVFFQKRKLNRAYKALFEKNLEIIDIQENSHEKQPKKLFVDAIQQELLDKILNIMKDTSIVCNPKFSVEELAKLIQTHKNNVSSVINTSLNKNFRSFLNGYRIREAQRLFSEPDAAKYTVESVANQVGFKSRNSFNESFKEITGVSPKFYLKSMQEQLTH